MPSTPRTTVQQPTAVSAKKVTAAPEKSNMKTAPADSSADSAARPPTKEDAAQEPAAQVHIDSDDDSDIVEVDKAADSIKDDAKESEEDSDEEEKEERAGKKKEGGQPNNELFPVSKTIDYDSDSDASRSDRGGQDWNNVADSINKLSIYIKDDKENTHQLLAEIKKKVDKLYTTVNKKDDQDSLLEKVRQELKRANSKLSIFNDDKSPIYNTLLQAEKNMRNIIAQNGTVKEAMQSYLRTWKEEIDKLQLIEVRSLLKLIHPLNDSMKKVEGYLTGLFHKCLIDGAGTTANPNSNNAAPKKAAQAHCIFCETDAHSSANCNQTKSYIERTAVAEQKNICMMCLKSMDGVENHYDSCSSKQKVCHLCPRVDQSMRHHHPTFCFSNKDEEKKGPIKNKLTNDVADGQPKQKKPHTAAQHNNDNR